MTDPRLELFNGTTLAFENNDWPATLADMIDFALHSGSRAWMLLMCTSTMGQSHIRIASSTGTSLRSNTSPCRSRLV